MGHLIDDLLAFFARRKIGDVSERKSILTNWSRKPWVIFKRTVKGGTSAGKYIRCRAVQADRALLRMALVNLISNAVKFTGHCTEAKIEIGCAPGNDQETVIFIRDNGAGFDGNYADKLFGVFQRLHSQDEFEGTGIGLANVRRIIQRHGGRTWAEGAVDAGATFLFFSPHSTPEGLNAHRKH